MHIIPKIRFLILLLILASSILAFMLWGQWENTPIRPKGKIKTDYLGHINYFEKEVKIYGPDGEVEMSMSLFHWGAIFYSEDEEIGRLKYGKVYYELTDSKGELVCMMMAHDTAVKVTDEQERPVMTIKREKKNRIEFLDDKGAILYYIVANSPANRGDKATVTLYARSSDTGNPSDSFTLVASASSIENGTLLTNPDMETLYIADPEISPAGLSTIMLNEYDFFTCLLDNPEHKETSLPNIQKQYEHNLLIRMAFMIMVK